MNSAIKSIRRALGISAAACVLICHGAVASEPGSNQFVRATFSSPTGLTLQPFSVNSFGRVVGIYFRVGGSSYVTEPFVWTPRGGIRALPSLDSGLAFATNECGETVGSVTIGSEQRAAKWTPRGELQFIDDLAGESGLRFSVARDINERGHIIAFAQQTVAPFQGIAVLWSSRSGATVIEPVRPGGFMFPLALNNEDEVVGISYPAPSEDGEDEDLIGHAFVWSRAQGARELMPASNLNSEAHDINDHHQIVGTFLPGDAVSRGALWLPDGTRTPLRSESPDNSAASINIHGAIVGNDDLQGPIEWTTPNHPLVVDGGHDAFAASGSDTNIIAGTGTSVAQGVVWFPRHPTRLSALKIGLCALRHVH